MSTISRNPFALLSEGDSDNESGPITTIKVPVAVAPVQPKKSIPGGQAPKRDRGDYPARGGPRKVYGGAPTPAPVGEVEVIGAKPAGFTEHGRDDRGERRGGGGRGRGGRGGRGGAGRGRGGGRFEDRPDRRSTTGVHDTDRKIAAGWGADEGKQELQAETEGWGDAKAAISPNVGDGENQAWGPGASATEDAAAGPNGHGPPGAGEAKPEEEEDRTKTFEEYLAEKANSTSPIIGFKKEARKPNEGVDDSQWKGAVQLIRGPEQEEVFFQVSKEKKAANAVSSKKTKEKTYIEVEPLGYRPPRAGGERGGRGGRGGGRDFGDRESREPREFGSERRGRGGRGGGRGGRGGNSGAREFNAEDSNAFPSLS